MFGVTGRTSKLVPYVSNLGEEGCDRFWRPPASAFLRFPRPLSVEVRTFYYSQSYDAYRIDDAAREIRVVSQVRGQGDGK